jgi:tyrosyl-tRNA synthetase
VKKFDRLFSGRSRESLVGISSADFLDFLTPKWKTVIDGAKLQERLANNSSLRVKFGIDPTGAELHLGHLVPMMVLDLFARAGHTIQLVIGTFTAQVGDPSGRTLGRDPLSNGQIMANLATYKEQIGRFLDLERVTFRHNGDWLSTMTLGEIFAILQGINLAEATQREDFRARQRNNQAVSLAEVCYGVLMGIDSVKLGCDVELGGDDQLLNFHQCREVMGLCGMEREIVITTPILEGTTGNGVKMSKSFGNTIPLGASAQDLFGKIMSLPDTLVSPFFKHFACVRGSELPELEQAIASDPLEMKKQLATLMVELRDGETAGEEERQTFERRFSQRHISDEDCQTLLAEPGSLLQSTLADSGHFNSRSEVRRLFQEKAVRAQHGNSGNWEVLTSKTTTTEVADCTVKVGRRFFKIRTTAGVTP